MSIWDAYPTDYRAAEVGVLAAAVNAGECVSVVGLSGAGKSNLLGFIANRPPPGGVHFALVDCNRLRETAPGALFKLIRAALDDPSPAEEEWPALESAVAHQLAWGSLCLLFDRFDPLAESAALAGNLRALRDAHKYDLTFVIAARRPLPARTELAELFAAHTLWLGPLCPADARWNVERYMQRLGQRWGDETVARLIQFSGAYPSLLRAACEAYATDPDPAALADHPAVRARLEEFRADAPSPDELQSSGLAGHPLLAAITTTYVDTSQLTAKENLLLICLRAHPDAVCEKDDIIGAVWPEDKVFERGVRDDSLAQLVRRLREKIEPDPAHPRFIHTVPGRGYVYRPAGPMEPGRP